MYGDKLIDEKDMDNFHNMKFEIAKQFFEVGLICTLKCTSTPHTVYTHTVYTHTNTHTHTHGLKLGLYT